MTVAPITWEFPYPSQRMPVMADNMVATSQPLAAQAGLRMLLAGGNAVDAALATAIALTVVEPTGNGIGGDAFAILWDGNRLHGLNGSGRSPRAWSPERFSGLKTMPAHGWDAVTVPGAVDAWSALSARFGRLEFARLFEPAIQYARYGFYVTPRTAALWDIAARTLGTNKEFAAAFLPLGRAPRPGERFQCHDQARTLEEIAASRGDSFYRGALARRIASHAHSTGGMISEADLADHHSQWVTPMTQEYHGIDLHEIPPNGQGLAALIALGILEHHDLSRYYVDSADSIHLQVEAMKLAVAEVQRHIADPSWMEIDPQSLLTADLLAQRAAQIRMECAASARACIPVDRGTVCLSAADENGMMISYIQSNFQGFGSGIVTPGTGISFQNRAQGFCLEPGHPNRVDGGKRPYHTIIPGFMTCNGRPKMSFGVMGGHMQPQGHVQLVTRIVNHCQNPQSASDAPRWHVTEDFQLALEAGTDPDVTRELVFRGHPMAGQPESALFGGAQLIYRLEDQGYIGASDHRKDGQAVGF